ncbi:CPBP family intramembrane glutamic endopeptidase [Thermospira aquatica]|uniref:CPBP family intramembrane metalloprotease n=1 Tax=Thermospira aquatica TaxID=2828656 RepID=A0AAX3BF95_9SPIR|nr:type II CAAX endopeptidase family protein [Thermospira aquatica]URA11032.1 CPBP family intramembrane metalloprotease [Thermospira aquatica]
MKKLQNSHLWFSLVWATFILFVVPIGVSRFAFLIFGPPAPSLAWKLTMLVQFVLAYSLVFFCASSHPSRKALFRLPQKPARLFGTLVLVWTSVLFSLSGLVFILAILANMGTEGQIAQQLSRDLVDYQGAYGILFGSLEYGGFWEKVAIFVLVVGLVPMTEEWLFRGLVFDSLTRHFSPRWTILFQAGLFAVLHPLGFYTIFYLAIGLLLGWFRYTFRSLWAGIWAHQFQNSLAFVSFLGGGREMLTIDPMQLDPGQLWIIVPFTLIMVGIAILAIRSLVTWPTTPTENSGQNEAHYPR